LYGFHSKGKKKLKVRYKVERNVAKTGQLGTLFFLGPILLISIANLANLNIKMHPIHPILDNTKLKKTPWSLCKKAD
jgi:hypothetical protein